MRTSLQFHEYEDALLVRKTSYQSAWLATVLGVAAGVFAALCAGDLGLPTPMCLLLALAVCVVVGLVNGTLPRRAELRVSNLDYVSRTSGVMGIKQAESISRMDARWLEFREDSSGPEGGDPGGLYVVLKHRSVCMLPDLNAEQTTEVIERIGKKFPSFRKDWMNQSAFGPSEFGKNVITLGLDRRPESTS